MKKHVAVIAAFAVLTSVYLTSATTYASTSTGWVRENDNWRYYSNNGEMLTERWQTTDEGRYYLGQDGYMLTSSSLELNDNRYYFDASGNMVRDQWRLLDTDEGEFWHYFGADGKAYRGTDKNTKRSIGGKYYYFDENGRMLTGWFGENGDSLNDNEAPFVEAKYYSGEDGALYTDRWHRYNGIGGTDLTSSISDLEYSEYSEMWMYFDAKGVKAKSTNGKPLQRDLGGKTYGFDENGIMLQWWGIPAATSSDAYKYYSGYDNGELLKDKWIWMYPSKTMDEVDYNEQECSWWRVDSKGSLMKNKIGKVNGKKYAFDKIGRMQTGFVLFGSMSEFVASYDVDLWESKDFLNGNILGIERSNLYFFSANELNDGAMKTGSNLQIELQDGTFTFGFASNGKAYGNQNQLEKVSNKYYINGLRLEASTDMGYGVVEVDASASDAVYQVVNTSGSIVKGKGNSVVQEKDGGWLIIVDGKFKAFVYADEKPRWHNGPQGEGFYYYNSSHPTDKFAGGLIAGASTPVSIARLPKEGKLNFD